VIEKLESIVHVYIQDYCILNISALLHHVCGDVLMNNIERLLYFEHNYLHY